jgi:CHAT domain-containing protein
VARTVLQLAKVDWLQGNAAAALQGALRAERIGREHLGLTLRSLPERQALVHAARRAVGLDLALSIAVAGERSGPLEDILDALVRSRGAVLDEMAARHRTIVGAGDPAVLRRADELSHARTWLAHLVLRGPESEHPRRYQALLEDAARKKEAAERALAECSAAFRDELQRGLAGWGDVYRALGPGSALVAFVRYRKTVPRQEPESSRITAEETAAYVALVARAGAAVTLVPLGPAEEIEERVDAWRRAAANRPPAARPARRRAEARYHEAADGLRRAIWDPLAATVGDSRKVFVVPDGPLHLVNLATLPGVDGGFLVEGPLVFHHLSAERDLVPGSRQQRGHGLLALGAPSFDRPPGPPPPEGASTLVARAGDAGGYRGSLASCEDFLTRRMRPLPASREEVEAIAALWRSSGGSEETLLLVGDAAHEATLKGLAPGHRVLHLATHGFFLGGECRSALDASGDGALPTGLAHSAVAGDNPLLLSGLALAGFNRREGGGQQEDGVLTAEEIASLDLSGVEWVVLSACETGLGEIRPGEGVLGLRRAFQVAGAGTLIMSLWSVEDEATRQWMQHLYEGRSRDLPTVEAVRQASVEVLQGRRQAGRSTHPFYWGAFVAAGDWR